MNNFQFRSIFIFAICLGISQILFAKGPAATKATRSPGGGTLSGKVIEKENGTPLPGASVYIPDLRVGAITDQNGLYKLNNLPTGTYLVEIRFVGYATFSKQIDFTKTPVFDAQLSLSTIESEDVIITGVSKAT
jgi:iron complex outermembrane receptor protein